MRRRFGRVEALAGLDVLVAAGETYGPLGPNGSGKTTPIRRVAGLLRPDAGDLATLGRDRGRAPHRRPPRPTPPRRPELRPPAVRRALAAHVRGRGPEGRDDHGSELADPLVVRDLAVLVLFGAVMAAGAVASIRREVA